MKFGQESLGPTVCKREMAILWGVMLWGVHMKRLSYMTSNQTNNYEDELV